MAQDQFAQLVRINFVAFGTFLFTTALWVIWISQIRASRSRRLSQTTHIASNNTNVPLPWDPCLGSPE